jgi:hypothetical protein
MGRLNGWMFINKIVDLMTSYDDTLFLPLLMFGYTHEFTSLIFSSSSEGYRLTALPGESGGSKWSKAELNMRRISVDSLLTIVFVFLSHNTGTLYLPLLDI